MCSYEDDRVCEAGGDARIKTCLKHVETAEEELCNARSLLRSLVDTAPSQQGEVQKPRVPVGKLVPALVQNGINSAKQGAACIDDELRNARSRRGSQRIPGNGDKGTQTSGEDVKTMHMCWEDFDFISREAKQGLIDQVMLASKNFYLPTLDHERNGEKLQRRGSNASRIAENAFQPQLSLCSRIGVQLDGVAVNIRPVQFVPVFAKNAWFRTPVFDPQARIRIAWIFLGLAFIVYECFSIPIILCFESEPSGFFGVFGDVVTIYFLSDVLLSFFVGYVNSFGEVILDPINIAKQYGKTWFMPDCLASLPLEWFLDGGSSSLRLMRFFRLLRLARLVRILKMRSIMNAVQSKMEGRPMFRFGSRLFKLFGGLCLAMHWCACLWFFVGNIDADDQHNSWVKTWLPPDTPMIRKYVWSLYFSLTTMTTVGYGDITPKTYAEAQYALFLLPVASVVFATIMGNLTDLVTNMNAAASRQADQRMLLANYMNWREVPVHLRTRIRTYMIDLWDESRDWPAYEDTLKEDLSPVLLEELMMHIHSKVLTTAPFLLWLRGYPICIRQLSSKLTTTHLDSGDHLFLVGESNTVVYVLTSGTMWLSLNQTIYEDSDDHTPPRTTEWRPPTDFFKEEEPKITSRITLMKGESGYLKQGIKTQVKSGWKDFKTQVQRGRGSVKVAPKPCVDVSQADALLDSYTKMKVHDLRLKHVVMRVQRNWRSKKQDSKSYPKVQGLRSHMVYAPSYFGESCLWVPRWKWPDVAPKHMYNARCKKRADLVCIPRSAIDEILDRFAPWLPDRFEFFRKDVVENLKAAAEPEDGDQDDFIRQTKISKVQRSDADFSTDLPGQTKHDVD